MRGGLWWGLLLLGGCAEERLSTLSSEIIRIPPMPHGFYHLPLDTYPNGDRQVRIYVSDNPDLCDQYTDLQWSVQAGNDVWTAWEELLPARFWQAFVAIRVTDPWGELEGVPITVLDDVGVEPATNEAYVELARFLAPLDEAFFSGEVPADDYVELFLGEGGTADFAQWAPPRAAAATFSTTLTNSLGFRVGTLSGVLDLPRCGSWDQALRAPILFR